MLEKLKRLASRILNKEDYDEFETEIASSGCEDEQSEPC
jgi:hypothetical protein